MERPPPDQAVDIASQVEADRVPGRLRRLRDAVAGSTDPAALARFGQWVADSLELRATDVAPLGSGPEAIRQAFEGVACRFLDCVLADPSELGRISREAVAEYAAVDPDRPDPGRLAAGYGAARLRLFKHDRRLVYRVGGYRGRPGDPLADHLIAVVLTPTLPAGSLTAGVLVGR